MVGSVGKKRSAPAQSAKRGATRCVVRLVQAKPLLDVALMLLSSVGGRVKEVSCRGVKEGSCGMVMARAEEEKRARPKKGRWRSICIVNERWVGE